MSVSGLLTQAGLSHLIPNFRDANLSKFKSILLSDYDRWGVYDMSDKQALFKLLQELSADNSPHHPEAINVPIPRQQSIIEDNAASFLDLNADDDDFLADDDLDMEEFTSELSASPGQTTHSTGQSSDTSLVHTVIPKIRVIVRKRPLNRKESERGDCDVIECDGPGSILFVNEPKVKVDLTKYVERHTFRFDDVFDEIVDNETLYKKAIQPLVATIFHKGKGTVFAYGQTGSGKTYTMQPLPLRAAADIFSVISSSEYSNLRLLVSCYEIYGGKIYDLLNARAKLEVREDGKKKVQVVGLHQVDVHSPEVLSQLCEHAACARSTGSTGANDESSRSHSVMQFALKTSNDKLAGKLSFIDLAGSERGADTYENDKQTRLEGAEINKSLLALKECIRALDVDARHIPFRGSKLTSVLRDSFVGEGARTVMIANISPNSSSCEHTLNTLRYADRVKEIRKPPQQSGSVLTNGEGALCTSELASVFQRMNPGCSNNETPSVPPASVAVIRNVPPVPAQQQQQQQQQQRHMAAAKAAELSSRPPAAATAAAAVVKPVINAENNFYNNNGQQKAPIAATQPAPSRPVHPSSTQATSPKLMAVHPAHQAIQSTLSDISYDIMDPLAMAEDELVCAHRAYIEEMMCIVREEMNLLTELDEGSSSADAYTEDLGSLLVSMQVATASLQQQVAGFRKLLREHKQ